METDGQTTSHTQPEATPNKRTVIFNGLGGIVMAAFGAVNIYLGGRDWISLAIVLLCLGMAGWLLYHAVKAGRAAWRLDEEGLVVPGSITDRWIVRHRSRSGSRTIYWLLIEYQASMKPFAIRQRATRRQYETLGSTVMVRYLATDPQEARLEE
jgi:hypothetical protein